MPLTVSRLFICNQVILENMLDDRFWYTRFHYLTWNTKKRYWSIVICVSFIIFFIHRDQTSFLPIKSVKVAPRWAQNENRPVKGETMAGSASFNNLGEMSLGHAYLFGLVTFNYLGPNLRRRWYQSQKSLNNRCDRSVVENFDWLVQVLCRYWQRNHLLSLNLNNVFSKNNFNKDFVQGHPTTVFCEISVRRSKNCLEFSIAWGKLKISRWPFHSRTILEAYLINSYDFLIFPISGSTMRCREESEKLSLS